MSGRKMSNPKDVQYKPIEGDEAPVHTPVTRFIVGAVLALGVCGLIGLVTLVAYKIANAPAVPTPMESLANGFRNQPLKRVLTGVKTDSSGTIPDWLTGDLFTNGPAYFTSPTEHWFLGLALINKWSLSAADNSVAYSSQFVKSYDYNQTVAKLALEEAGMSKPLAALAKSLEEQERELQDALPSPNTDVTIWRINGHYLSNTEAPFSNEFDPVSLNTVAAPFVFGGPIPGNYVPAHSHFDHNGTFHHFGTIPQPPTYFPYTIAPNSNTRVPTGAGVKSNQPQPVYMHSFGLTDNYIILTENPVTFSPNSGGDFANYGWQPKWGTKFTVVDRVKGTEVAMFTADPFHCFHHINAFEVPANKTIVVDLVRLPDTTALHSLFLNNILNYTGGGNQQVVQALAAARPYRYILDMTKPGSAATSRKLSDVSFEFPQINHPMVQSKQHRYVYGAGIKDPANSVFNDRIVKLDTNDGSYKEWYHSHKVFAGEPLFVPNPKGKAEDDGAILCVMVDGRANNTFLLVLDASDLSESARATLSDTVVPLGFHGRYYAKGQ